MRRFVWTLNAQTALCSSGRAGLLMKDAKQGGGYKNLSLTWSRAAKDTFW